MKCWKRRWGGEGAACFHILGDCSLERGVIFAALAPCPFTYEA